MARTIFIIIVVLHGFIHLLGFLKAFKLAEIAQLTQPIARPAGFLWLITTLLFIAMSFAYLGHKEWWWMIAMPASVLSQALIILSWHDAKYGTTLNVVILTAAVVAYGAWSFHARAEKELKAFLSPATAEGRILTREMIVGLPRVVRRWLIRSNVINREIAHTSFVHQGGEMRTSPQGRWMAFTARQWVRTEKPGFLWLAEVRAAPGFHLAGLDKYEDGKGHMVIKLLSLIPVVNSGGSEIDQGSLVRYLAELVWCPSAAVSDHIHWERVDSRRAKAVMSYGGITAAGIFTFDAQGDVVSFEARRYYDRKGGATLEDWLINVDPGSFREFEGVRIAVRSTVTWKVKEGDFTWLRLEIADIGFNHLQDGI